MTAPPFHHVLDLQLPENKRAFVGYENGMHERARLTLDTLERVLVHATHPQTICLCTRDQGANILTIPYLHGLLGPSIHRFGMLSFVSIYRIRSKPDRRLQAFDRTDLLDLALYVTHRDQS